MKVSGPRSTAGSGPARRSGNAGSAGDFRRALDSVNGPADAGSVETGHAIGNIDAMLAAQSVGDATDQEGRRRAVRRGEDLLDKLDEIRHGLLTGTLDQSRLTQLAAMVQARRDSVADPRLAALLDEIELRAQVELAKLSRHS